MSNGGRSMFSLTATSLETVTWMEEQGGRVWQASASLDHKSKCPGHSTCWLQSCLLHFSSTFFKKETCRPGEQSSMKIKKAPRLLHMLFPLPGLFFQPNLCVVGQLGLQVLFRNPWFQKTTFQIPSNSVGVYLHYGSFTLNWNGLLIGLYKFVSSLRIEKVFFSSSDFQCYRSWILCRRYSINTS